jgi:hypothetical protein
MHAMPINVQNRTVVCSFVMTVASLARTGWLVPAFSIAELSRIVAGNAPVAQIQWPRL